MKEKWVGIFWGFVLVLLGAYLLMYPPQSFVIHADENAGRWIVVFGVASLLFFTSYFLSGLRRWGWLFPATISGALALTIALGTAGVHNSYVGAPILASIAIPFAVAFAVEPRRNRWALIPMWIMGVLTVITILADWVVGELLGSLVLLSIAAPFLVVYLLNREQKWALIPASVLGVIGVIPLLTLRFDGEQMGALVMLLLALPFVGVYLFSRRNWWALIPAGIFMSISLGVLAAGLQLAEPVTARLVGGIILSGWALVFLALWLRRAVLPTAWAAYPAILFGVLAVSAVIAGEAGPRYAWPLAIIVGGVLMLYRSYQRKPAQ